MSEERHIRSSEEDRERRRRREERKRRKEQEKRKAEEGANTSNGGEQPLTFEALAEEFDDDTAPKAKPEPGEAKPKKKKELDDNRPILVSSGYQGPSKMSWVFAFLFFGLAGFYLMVSVPEIRGIMWPFEAKGPEYDDPYYQPPIQETNRLRDTRNVSTLNLLYQVPFFVITWGFVLAYIGAIGMVILHFFPFIGDWLRKKLDF